MAIGEEAAAAEALISQFKFDKLLNQDQAGRRIVLQGTIKDQSALLLAERAPFSAQNEHLQTFITNLSQIKNLGANDVYAWFMASTSNDTSSPSDLKLNLICPCSPSHIKKYTPQGLRIVTESPEIYASHVQPYMKSKRDQGRLNWVFNILDGKTEQEDVLFREEGEEKGFLVLPDLNWDRKTVGSLHLLGLVQRRDIWSLRDLTKDHVEWLKEMRLKLLKAATGLYPDIEADQLKLYVHYQPTYYHFHIHIVHVSLEAGATQAVGKAFGLENIISQLEGMQNGKGMADVSLTYHLGEQSELWSDVFLPLKLKST